MTPELARFDRAIAELTAEGQPFAVNTVCIDGVEFRNYAAMPANLGDYFKAMQKHGDKVFAIYREERYRYAEAYGISAAFARALETEAARTMFRFTTGDTTVDKSVYAKNLMDLAKQVREQHAAYSADASSIVSWSGSASFGTNEVIDFIDDDFNEPVM